MLLARLGGKVDTAAERRRVDHYWLVRISSKQRISNIRHFKEISKAKMHLIYSYTMAGSSQGSCWMPRFIHSLMQNGRNTASEFQQKYKSMSYLELSYFSVA